jgi:hypothetical protein
MKQFHLARPAIIDGVLRYPVEGTLTRPDEVADQLYADEALTGEPESLDPATPPPPEKPKRG